MTRLAPLSTEDGEQVIENLGEVRAELRGQIVHTAGGNPLFLEQLLGPRFGVGAGTHHFEQRVGDLTPGLVGLVALRFSPRSLRAHRRLTPDRSG